MKETLVTSALLLGLALAPMQGLADPIVDALVAPDRLESDIERDVRSLPDLMLPLLNLQPGDRVADIWAGGGYYSELISRVVGPTGEVLLVNNKAYTNFSADALAARMTDRDIGSVTVHNREADDLDLGRNTLNAALIIMSYHDLYYVDPKNGWTAIDAGDFLQQIATALKPGGRFLIVDHNAAPGTGKASAQTLHRIDIEFAKTDIEAHGFKLVGESNALRNPNDDGSLSVFDPAVAGQSDRFVLVFEKS